MKKMGVLFIILAVLQSIFLAAVMALVSIFTSRKLREDENEHK